MRLPIPERPPSTLWDHNGHDHDYLLQHLPARAGRALDAVDVSPVDTAVGIWKAARETSQRPESSRPAGPPVAMPVRDPQSSLRQIRAEAGRLMPGARVRRHLFYRYSIVWQRPLTAGAG